MAVRCRARYRNSAIYAKGKLTPIYAEPGEVLRELDAEVEAYLLRDSPESWEPFPPPEPDPSTAAEAEARALDAPPEHRMIERETATRKESERDQQHVMTAANSPLSRNFPKGRKH